MAHPLVAEAMQADRDRLAKRLKRARKQITYTAAQEQAQADLIGRLERELEAADRLVIDR